MKFVHLHCHTPFSFLDGASPVEELVQRAAELDMPALAVTDHNNLSAAVQFAQAAIKYGIKAIQGVEIKLADNSHLTLLSENNRGYASLCQLVTRSHLNNPRGQAAVNGSDLEELQEVIVLSGCRQGSIPCSILRGDYQRAWQQAQYYKSLFGGKNFYIELQNLLLPGDNYLNQRLLELARQLDLEVVASNNVHYTGHEDFFLHDVLCCARKLITVSDIDPGRPLNGENYLKSAAQMEELFAGCPQALTNTLRITERCQAFLHEPVFHFPRFPLLPGQEAAGVLRQLVWQGAQQRYKKITPAITARLEYELGIIEQMGFPDYFLVVWDLARYSRQEGIRYAGRGSAADSLAAYCLGITAVDSLQRGLLFERFMNPERVGMPDIDIDFESRYRDKVIDYVYKKYGSEYVARVATYNTFRARSALRELGKALAFPEPELDPLCKRMPFYARADQIRSLLHKLPELKDSPLHEPRFELLLDCCDRLAGFPRFLGMHLGGLVISDIPITSLTPLQESGLGPVISQFDKDDIEGLGLVKLDLLSLRTLSVIQDATAQIRQSDQDLDYEAIPLDDRETFAMINRGETIGVFQLESPAQRALQTRFQASEFEDVVASMALIRPGPIKGNMVDPYVDRRLGKEEVSYLHPWLEPILKKTYGVVLFQEQVIEIGQAIAGFTPAEADQLRRVMTHSRSHKMMEELGHKFVERSVNRGIETSLAEEIFQCMLGYASYGFCEAHAAAFATTSYKSAYLIRHYPAEYYTAILNHQPMGFYPPRIIGNEARRRRIDILPPDVTRSGIDFTVEMGAIRVGLKQIKGLSAASLGSIIAAREQASYTSPLDFVVRTAVPQNSLENLVRCGALDSLCGHRRFVLSQLYYYLEKRQARENGSGLLFEEQGVPAGIDFSTAEKRSWEYSLLGLYVGEHPMAAWRPILRQNGFKSSHDLQDSDSGRLVWAAGLLLHPHRPPTRSGRITVFFSLEDEYGIIDATMFEDVYMQCGSYIFGPQNGPLLAHGKIHRRGEGVSLIVQQVLPCPLAINPESASLSNE